MKTLIAIPCMDSVPVQFAQSLAILDKRGDCLLSMKMGSLIYTSRNDLALQAIRNECDYVFWLDSDMIFPSDILIRMMDEMESEKLDVLSGLYFRRVKPFAPVIFERLRMNPDGSVFHRNWNKDYPKNELFEVEGIGFGCVLMRTNVLVDVFAQFNDMFAPINGVGEDLSFCWRARKCGYKIMVDSRLKLGHVGHYVINEEFYNSFNSIQ